MTRRIRFLAFAALVSLAIATGACADLTSPSADGCTGHQGSENCP